VGTPNLEDDVFKVRKLAATVAAATIMVTLVAATLFTASPAGAEGADTTAIEQDFIARINGLRASQGLGQLANDSAQLTDVARSWASSMADAGSISHRPNLVDVAPSNWQKIGENVGVGSDAGTLHAAFVASPGHYKNLVDPGFTTVSVGVVVRDGRIFVTENFMSTRGGAAPSAPAAAPGAAAPGESAAAAPAAEASAAAGSVASGSVIKVKRVCKAGKCRYVKVKVKAKKKSAKRSVKKRSIRRR
jgi:uncharacterized protein YkwD